MPGMSCPDVGIEDVTGMSDRKNDSVQLVVISKDDHEQNDEVTTLQMVSEQVTTSDSTGATENLTSDHQTTKSMAGGKRKSSDDADKTCISSEVSSSPKRARMVSCIESPRRLKNEIHDLKNRVKKLQKK